MDRAGVRVIYTSGKLPYGPEKYIVRKNLLCSAQWVQMAFAINETFSYFTLS